MQCSVLQCSTMYHSAAQFISLQYSVSELPVSSQREDILGLGMTPSFLVQTGWSWCCRTVVILYINLYIYLRRKKFRSLNITRPGITRPPYSERFIPHWIFWPDRLLLPTITISSWQQSQKPGDHLDIAGNRLSHLAGKLWCLLGQLLVGLLEDCIIIINRSIRRKRNRSSCRSSRNCILDVQVKKDVNPSDAIFLSLPWSDVTWFDRGLPALMWHDVTPLAVL